MKRIIYIILFTFLGILLQLLVHSLLELLVIWLLTSNFSLYGLGLSWSQWYLIHHVLTGLFLIGGALFGWWQGKYWWQKIYVEKIR